MCGLLYSGESVEHFFEMVEDFRQPIGAGKHQPGGVFAAADVREYVGPVSNPYPNPNPSPNPNPNPNPNPYPSPSPSPNPNPSPSPDPDPSR